MSKKVARLRMLPAESNGSRRRKTVLRTLRLPEETANALDSIAQEDGTTLNAAVTSVINEYVNWTRKARKYGFANVSKRVLRLILEATDDEKLRKGASMVNGDIMKDEMLFFYREASPDALMKLWAELGQHSDYLDTSYAIENKKYTLAIHHELGPKFSTLVRLGLDTLIRREFHAQPEFEEAETSLIVRFSLPHDP
jgi:hypothetical protein